MAEVVTINIDGQNKPAVELTFEIIKEDWCEYELADGGRIRLRSTATKIYGLIDGEDKPLRDAMGDRIVSITHATQVVASG
ncbi:MAG: hypothetical protein OXG19_03045 [Chloroflexi bacterium]|nr:hypothetical protein [Chloroflexota bacterium]